MLLGPPAVGKLTVGRILSDITNYPLFDNSKTVDLALLLYNYNLKKFRDYRLELRMGFYKRAVLSEIKGLISTLCIRHPNNWNYVLSVEKLFTMHNWDTHYFVLNANKEILIKRSESIERKTKSSLSNRQQIEDWLKTSVSHTIDKIKTFTTIDTDTLEANDVARLILKEMNIFYENNLR